jgi:predicted nucleotidyltransferase
MIDDKTINEIVSRITKACGDCRVYLFGSYAYGEPQIGSDLDIAVIMEEVQSKIKMAIALGKLLEDIPYPKDIIVSSAKEFNHFSHEPGSLFRTIAEKGVLLHE